jgi:hypothetical protein
MILQTDTLIGADISGALAIVPAALSQLFVSEFQLLG